MLMDKREYETYDDGVSYEAQSVDGMSSPYGYAVTEERLYFCTAAEAEELLRDAGYWAEWFGFTPKLIPGRMYCIAVEEDVKGNVSIFLYGDETARSFFRLLKGKRKEKI